MTTRLPPITNNVKSARPRQNKGLFSVKLPPIINHDPKEVKQLWKKLEAKLEPILAPKLLVAEKEAYEAEADEDGIPKIRAELVKKIDFFSDFLAENNISPSDLTEYSKFLSFCQVHGDFERKQRLFYALKARKAVKLRQIEAVQRELRAFNDAALVFDQIMEMKKEGNKPLSELFSEMVVTYSDQSYELTILKSSEEFWSIKYGLQKAVADRGIDMEVARVIKKELKNERYFLFCLDMSIKKIVGNEEKEPKEEVVQDVQVDLRPESKQYIKALNQLRHLPKKNIPKRKLSMRK